MTDTIIEIRDHRDHGWFWAQNELLDNHSKEIGVYGTAVYMALARFANNRTQKAWPGLRKLAAMLNTGRNQIRTAIDMLEDANLITVQRRPNNSHVYTLVNLKHIPPVEGGSAEDPPLGEVGPEQTHLGPEQTHLGPQKTPPGSAPNPELDLGTRLTKQDLNQDWDSPLFAKELWWRIRDDLDLQITKAAFDLWLKDSEGIAFEAGTLTVHLPSPAAVDWVTNRMAGMIQRSLDYHSGLGHQIHFTNGET